MLNQLTHDLEHTPGFNTDYQLEPEELDYLRECINKRKLSDHDFIRHKKNRLFSNGEVRRIKEFRFFDKVRAELGYFTLSDVCYDDVIEKGREEVYFRVSRPNEAGDVAPMHRDTDHHRANPDLHPTGERTVKVWIPVESELGLNGLLVVRNSHIGDCPPAQLLLLEPGHMVIFHENLMHGGALNVGDKNRISIEITLCWAAK